MDFLKALAERVLVFDGAMGTSIQRLDPSLDDYEGHDGLNEWLSLSRPDWIRGIHAGFLAAGCDVVETNTFGAFGVVLGEYGLAAETRRVAEASARLAREAVDAHSTGARPRWVAGSIGPGTRLPSLGQIGFDELQASYEPLVDGLLAGGADLLLVETCQDLLQVRAALAAVRAAFARAGRRLPVGVQVTMESTGAMLLGTEMPAAIAALLPLKPDFLGLNCATGPAAMAPHVRTLASQCPLPFSVLPNAGLPRTENGRMVYDLGPAEFAEALGRFVERDGAAIVGGCCGTGPEHLEALVRRVHGRAAPRREAAAEACVTSLFSAVPLEQKPAPLLIGERANANGSKAFRRLLLAEDWEGMAALARSQADEGAHAIDVCLALVGRDEGRDWERLLETLASSCPLPVMVDSTDPAAMETALKRLGGRCLLNSINLEDGEPRARQVLELARRHGSAVVALCIDEEGMARGPERKLAVARRLVALAAEHGLGAGDLLIDPLTFTLGSGDPDSARAGLDTLEAIRLIKREIPESRTLLGLSNISFGLKPGLRRALNSVYLHRALAAGLDAAILHAGQILPPHELDPGLAAACEALIDADHRQGDPLARLLELGGSAAPERADADGDLPVEARLARRIVQGRSAGIGADLDEALAAGHGPFEIINRFLLDGMKEVGELFGAGRLQLPFVLKSAETMKHAVGHLEPAIRAATQGAPKARGRLLLATVRGDVHDIGKNLVDIILSNNGFEVENLGIKVPVERLLQAIEAKRPDAVGLSGLLVKSTLVMRENLLAFAEAGVDLPVLLGGAALTRRYVEDDLRPLYGGPLHYARDAFDGLRLMEALCEGAPLPAGAAAAEADGTGEEAPAGGPLPGPDSGRPAIEVLDPRLDEAPAAERCPVLDDPPAPPFRGSRVTEAVPLREVFAFINTATLFRGEWGFKRGRLDAEEWRRLEEGVVRPLFERLKREAEAEGWLRPAAVHGWFPAASEGRRLWIWGEPEAAEPSHWLDFPRQGRAPFRCLSDFFAPRSTGRRDALGLQLVTVGAEASEHAQRLLKADRYQDYLYAHGLGVESAEALAELWHKRLREELGIAGEDAADLHALFRQGYRGSRYSPGYPACPRLEDQRTIFELLGAERIGCSLTEEWQIVPEQSTCALVVHHPEAKYFGV